MPTDARRPTEYRYVGRVAYREGLAVQGTLREEVRAGGAEALLLLEHPHVYTVGRNADRADVVAPAERLAELGVEVHECNRGGQVTYHGPGQLVGYPVVDLDPDRRDLRRYVHDLQEVLVRTLSEFGIAAEGRREPPAIGVWAGERKVASIGVHVARWVTTHGFALNVTTDLSYFRGIVACGLPGVEMASIESLTARRPPLTEVAEAVAGHFADVFDRRLAPLSADRIGAWATGS